MHIISVINVSLILWQSSEHGPGPVAPDITEHVASADRHISQPLGILLDGTAIHLQRMRSTPSGCLLAQGSAAGGTILAARPCSFWEHCATQGLHLQELQCLPAHPPSCTGVDSCAYLQGRSQEGAEGSRLGLICGQTNLTLQGSEDPHPGQKTATAQTNAGIVLFLPFPKGAHTEYIA